MEHPDSIGSKYIKQSTTSNQIDVITNIVVEHIQQNIHLLPKDIEHSTVIHVRLGDVIAGNHFHEIDYLKSIVDTNKLYVIGKCFFAKPIMKNVYIYQIIIYKMYFLN